MGLDSNSLHGKITAKFLAINRNNLGCVTFRDFYCLPIKLHNGISFSQILQQGNKVIITCAAVGAEWPIIRNAIDVNGKFLNFLIIIQLRKRYARLGFCTAILRWTANIQPHSILIDKVIEISLPKTFSPPPLSRKRVNANDGTSETHGNFSNLTHFTAPFSTIS